MASYRPFEAPSAGYPAPGGLNKSTSFSDKDKQEFIVRAQKLNTLLEQLTMNNGGPSKNSFKDFHTNFDAKMCYVEDVYHIRCNHWADKPRLYHSCAAANGTGPQRQCSNQKKCGSAQDDSYCQRCLIHADMAAGKDTGTWMTVYPNQQTGKVVVNIRDDARKSNPRVNRWKPKSQPSGFFRRKLEDS